MCKLSIWQPTRITGASNRFRKYEEHKAQIKILASWFLFSCEANYIDPHATLGCFHQPPDLLGALWPRAGFSKSFLFWNTVYLSLYIVKHVKQPVSVQSRVCCRKAMRDIPEWPHQSCQPNLNHFTNVKWLTRWEGRDGITLHRFPACRCWEQLFYKKTFQYRFEMS